MMDQGDKRNSGWNSGSQEREFWEMLIQQGEDTFYQEMQTSMGMVDFEVDDYDMLQKSCGKNGFVCLMEKNEGSKASSCETTLARQQCCQSICPQIASWVGPQIQCPLLPKTDGLSLMTIVIQSCEPDFAVHISRVQSLEVIKFHHHDQYYVNADASTSIAANCQSGLTNLPERVTICHEFCIRKNQQG